jgi:enamine deaminase RidA (YjgF/YER057c/UK114 family)
MEAQARNVFGFIHNTLAEGGYSEADVAKLYIYFHAEGDWREIERQRAVIARVQREFYPDPGPAVTAIRVAGFAYENLLLEIEAFGTRPA